MQALHEQCSVSVTHVTGAGDAVVVAVGPAAAVGHTSVLALNHTICMKHGSAITIVDVLMPMRLPQIFVRQTRGKLLLCHLYTLGSRSLGS